MCGFVGFVGGDWPSRACVAKTIEKMQRTILHRGPDSQDLWIEPHHRVAFAHNRLSIIDRSAAGSQPMASHSGRYVIVYNGEIYNHGVLREELALRGITHDWIGHSDTETLLAAVERWGIRGALERAVGMFAFALWDRAEATLVLARDRIGEKPLYYGRQRGGGVFLFGSELKALAEHPDFIADIDRQALTLLLRYNYVPAPFSIYTGIRKLSPGTFLTLRSAKADPVIEEYWSTAVAAKSGATDPLPVEPEDALRELERLLELAVAQQIIADVPLGAFLSGGVDSSMVVALMQKLSPRPVKTFSIGFHEQGYNEAEHAKAVANHLGTDHTELYVTADETRAVIPKLPLIYDEPFADSSQIPTYLVSELAKQNVTVALSGDGGDELFGGYNRYRFTTRLWKKIAATPKPLRRVMARAITLVPPWLWNELGFAATGFLPRAAQVDRLGDKMHKGAPLLPSDSIAELYRGMLSQWPTPESVVIGATEPLSRATAEMPQLTALSPIERMMALDLISYLPDDILVKVDRAAMAVSLETRMPYLDHRVVEFAWRVPFHLKIRDGQTKWILRQLLYRHVPCELIDRPKTGFSVPIGSWLRDPLKEWAEELLDPKSLREDGYFHAEPISRAWRAHLSGKSDEQGRLWGVLMFQSWLRGSLRPQEADRQAQAVAVA